MPTRMRWTVKQIQELHRFLEDYKKRDGSYRYGYKVDAALKFKVDPHTIYNVLKRFPEPPQRRPRRFALIPQFAEDFEELDSVKRFLELKGGILKSRDYLATGMKAWRILGNRDPASWEEEDYRHLWQCPELRDPETGLINYSSAVGLRQWMVVADLQELRDDPFFSTKGLKREKGRKLTHWLSTEEELARVVDCIEYPDTLMMFNLGIQCGARFSSLSLVRPEDIMYSAGFISMRESKVRRVFERIFPAETLGNIRAYIDHFCFKLGEKVFPRSMCSINEDLSQAGVKAGIGFDLTTHTAMKHTFVSFASNHGVSFEVVAKQSGTNPGTLMEFYAGIGREKMRHELLGESWSVSDYSEVMKRLQVRVRERFDEVKIHPVRRVKIERSLRLRVKRGISWKAIRKMIEAPDTPLHLKEYWIKKLESQNQMIILSP